MRAVIFANGILQPPVWVEADDQILAADGGALHCLALGITPTVVIGDLDSLSTDDLATLKISGSEIIQFRTDKDFTDLELALQYAEKLPVDEIVIYGALGSRWDQTAANLALPAAYPHLRIRLVDGDQEIAYLRDGENLAITGQPGDTVSLIPLAGPVIGITTRNLKYSLEHETLAFGSTRGVSNKLEGKTASVHVDNGLLLCITIHNTASEE